MCINIEGSNKWYHLDSLWMWKLKICEGDPLIHSGSLEFHVCRCTILSLNLCIVFVSRSDEFTWDDDDDDENDAAADAADSVSCERESSASYSYERQTSVDRLTSISGSLSGSVNESYSSGYASCSVKAAPQFTLPLIDQLVCVGHKCVFSVLCTFTFAALRFLFSRAGSG